MLKTLCIIFALAVVQTACDDSAAPIAAGELHTRITAGGVQAVVAGAPRLPESVVGQASRGDDGTALMAANAVSTTVQFLPNVVMCVGEDQLELIPFTRCVNTDAEGKAKFTFSPTTKAGTYR